NRGGTRREIRSGVAYACSEGAHSRSGRAEAVGRPILYQTTKQFLQYLGLSGLRDLPDAEGIAAETELGSETRMLFEKLGEKNQQLTIDDLPDSSKSNTDA